MKFIKVFLAIFITSIVIQSCSTVPVSGRKQLTLIPSNTILSLGSDNYSTFLKENKSKVVTNTAQAKMVKNVGNRIKVAVEQYMKENGQGSKLSGFNWEFNLIEDNSVNAWAMPGGKIVFYTGILPITQNEDGLAVVMGHEIAHVIAGHGNERMTQGLLAQAGQVALSVYMQDKPQETQAAFMTAYGVGAQVGALLPFSRLHEREADKLGLIFMAMAGYDPMEASRFWKRMSDLGGQRPPEFLSTHPAPESRMRDLESSVPEAQKYQKQK